MYHQRHLATLDGLRGVAALAVLFLHIIDVLHLKTDLPHAHLAVDFFFVLSGFVVAKAYEEKLKTSMTFSRFVAIRLIRLYPMILVGVFLGAFVLAARLVIMHTFTWYQLSVATLSALVLLPTTAMASLYSEVYPVNPPIWSLFFELAINFVYAPLVRWLNTRRLVVVCVFSGIALCFAAVSQHRLDFGCGQGNFFLGFIRVTFPFAVGVLLFRYRPSWRVGDWASIALALLLMTLLFLPVFKESGAYEVIVGALAFPGIVFVGAACANTSRLTSVCLSLGELSYPLYVTHQPVVRIVGNAIQLVHVNVSTGVAIGTSLIMTILVAILLLKMWDRPVRNWLVNAMNKEGNV